MALLRVLREMQQAALEGLARTRVLLIPAPAVGDASTAEAWREIEASAPAGGARYSPTSQRLLGEFKSLLADSLMGTRLYVAGPESFIGLAMKIALEFNLNKDEIRAEELGSLARRVYCIHCRTTTENVRDEYRPLPGLRALAAGARSLFAPPRGLHGRDGGCRSARRIARHQGGIRMREIAP